MTRVTERAPGCCVIQLPVDPGSAECLLRRSESTTLTAYRTKRQEVSDGLPEVGPYEEPRADGLAESQQEAVTGRWQLCVTEVSFLCCIANLWEDI